MPHKIIVADASPTLQRIVQGAFPEAEFQLFPFDNGDELIASAERIRPDAVLISVSLDGRDGYETARALRKQAATRRTPVFFLKGTFEALDTGRISGIEHDGILVKPVDSEGLVAKARKAIEKRKTPTSLPEELPVGGGGGEGKPPEGHRESGPVSGRSDTALDGGVRDAADNFRKTGSPAPHARVREWVRAEVCELERELEKRIRTRILAEINNPNRSRGNSGER